jgi:membrane protein
MQYADDRELKAQVRASRLIRARQFILEGIWHDDRHARPAKRLGLRVLRIITLIGQGLDRTESFIRASALTYITVLSLVPFLALAFSVAKGLDAFESLENEVVQPFLDETFPQAAFTAPDGEGPAGTRQAVEKVLGFVKDTSFGKLGTIGLLFLIWAAQKMLTSIEQAFNRIWGIRKQRSWVRKLTDYTALMVVTPILLLAATTAGSALQTERVKSWVSSVPGLSVIGYIVPLLALWIAFTFLYICMPNTKVPLKSAFIGGIVGGTLWYIFQILHVRFQVGIAGYSAMYASFAAFPIFLAWLYSVFVIILVGALVAWAHEHEPMYSTLRRAGVDTMADRELVALRALRAIAEAFHAGKGMIKEDELAAQCGLPVSKLMEILDPLENSMLIAHVNDPIAGWLPAKPLDTIRLQDVLTALRGVRAKKLEDGDDTAKLVDTYREAAATTKANRTMAELAAKG